MSSVNSELNDKVPYARACYIIKWRDFDGYGFNLHAERGKSGQFIGKVDAGSPSEAAGLKQGDRIVEVNDVNIANETHKQVVDRIKAFRDKTKLLVVDQEADNYFKANNIVIKGTMANIKVLRTPEKNPATVDPDANSDMTSCIEESTDKSTNMNDTTNSSLSASSTATPTPTSQSDSSSERHTENGNSVASEENGTKNGKSDEYRGLNLKMSAKELRAQLAMRKKYDPKKESIGFKDKFDIVQKL